VKFLCLMSVGNAVFTTDLLSRYLEWCQFHGRDLECVVLDEPHRHNLQGLKRLPRSMAAKEAERMADVWLQKISVEGLAFVSWSSFCGNVDFDRQLGRVEDAFFQDLHFQNDCLNQTFSNLKPKFDRIGVGDKADYRVELCSRYLREEIAGKIGAVESGEYAGEIMPHPENELVLKVYAGEYLGQIRGVESFLIVEHDGKSTASKLPRDAIDMR